MLCELRGDLSKLNVDLFQTLFARGIQVRALPAEGVDGFRQIAPALARKSGGLGCCCEALDVPPKRGMQRDSRVEGAYLRLCRVEGGTQLRIRRHRFEVPNYAHSPIQRLRELVQSVHGIGVSALAVG